MTNKPNILMIMTDQQSFNMMSCAGNQYVKTPALDSIANDGVMFERCYCANPVCLPSRFSLFTGRYPSEAGFSDNSYRKEIKYLPKEITDEGFAKKLCDAGYEPVYGGKEHFPYFGAADLGFHYICKDERENLAKTCAKYILERKNEKPFMMVASFINPHDICLMAINDFASRSDNVADKALRFILRRETKNVNKARKIPKGMSREEFFKKHCPPLPDNYLPAQDEPEFISMLQNDRGFKKLARAEYSDEDWRLHRYAYRNLTEKVDSEIAVVIDALKKSGQYDNTVIIFTSDHGDMDASHKMEHKECLYEEACHVPLLIKGVGEHPVGEKSGFVVCNGMDFLPTVLDYAGIEKPQYLEGLSLKGIAQGESAPEREIICVECAGGTMVTDGRYKYTRYFKGERSEQFCDLEVNRGEMYNQIDDPQYAEQVQKLKLELDAHLARQAEKCLYDSEFAKTVEPDNGFAALRGSKPTVAPSMKR